MQTCYRSCVLQKRDDPLFKSPKTVGATTEILVLPVVPVFRWPVAMTQGGSEGSRSALGCWSRVRRWDGNDGRLDAPCPKLWSHVRNQICSRVVQEPEHGPSPVKKVLPRSRPSYISFGGCVVSRHTPSLPQATASSSLATRATETSPKPEYLKQTDISSVPNENLRDPSPILRRKSTQSLRLGRQPLASA